MPAPDLTDQKSRQWEYNGNYPLLVQFEIIDLRFLLDEEPLNYFLTQTEGFFMTASQLLWDAHDIAVHERIVCCGGSNWL